MQSFGQDVWTDNQQCHLCGSESAQPLCVLRQCRKIVDLVKEDFGAPVQPSSVLQEIDKFRWPRLDPVHDDRLDRVSNRRLSGPLYVKKVRCEFYDQRSQHMQPISSITYVETHPS